MIDMHIAQVRPGIIQETSYIPPHMNDAVWTFKNDANLNNMFFEHFHRWREPPRTDLTVKLRFEEQLKNRPTTDHYDHDKGVKYDIEWTEDMKFPHVASRLGFPEFKEVPFERIVGLERLAVNPGF